MAESTNSLADLMKQNARLKKHVATAQKVVAQKDFTGPEGEYLVRFTGVAIVNKSPKIYYILNFKVDGSVEGQDEQNGARMGILHGLHDTDRQTAEQGLDNLMVDLQKMGVATADMSLADVDKAVKSLVNNAYMIRAVKAKKPGQTGFYFNLAGVASAGSETPDYSTSETTKAETPSADTGEWDDELSEDLEDAPEQDESASSVPSDWVGYLVKYKNPKTGKIVECTVKSADDTTEEVVLEKDGKTLKTKFSELILD